MKDDRVPRLRARGAYAKQAVRDKLIDHKQDIAKHGEDRPEIQAWRWGGEANGIRSSRRDTAADF